MRYICIDSPVHDLLGDVTFAKYLCRLVEGNSQFHLYGRLGRCGGLLSFAHGKPEEFTARVWEVQGGNKGLGPAKWISRQEIKFSGVKWTIAEHTGDCSCCCTGFASFTASDKYTDVEELVIDVEQGKYVHQTWYEFVENTK